jgi:translation initiation factor 2 beta subunit (eIF-2beta)/eIF-5
MGLLAEVFENEFVTIGEEIKEQIHDIVIEQTARELIEKGLVRYPEELKLFLEYISDYIYGILEKDQIFNEDEAYQKLPLLLSVNSGIIEAVQFLKDTGILENINWKRVAKYGAGLALAGLGGIAAAHALANAQFKSKEAEEDQKANDAIANEKIKKSGQETYTRTMKYLQQVNKELNKDYKQIFTDLEKKLAPHGMNYTPVDREQNEAKGQTKSNIDIGVLDGDRIMNQKVQEIKKNYGVSALANPQVEPQDSTQPNSKETVGKQKANNKSDYSLLRDIINALGRDFKSTVNYLTR